VPTRYVGKKVWVRGGLQNVQFFLEGQMIKTMYVHTEKAYEEQMKRIILLINPDICSGLPNTTSRKRSSTEDASVRQSK